MSRVSNMVDAQERLYVMRDEASRSRKVGGRKKPRRNPGKPADLHALEVDIHPRCSYCGERIDVGMCAKDACATLCSRCAADEAKR